MVIRILAVPDSLRLHEFDEVFRAVLGWDNIGFLFHVHGQEFNSFRRATRPSPPARVPTAAYAKPSCYTCGADRSLGVGSPALGRRTRICRRRCAAVPGWPRRRAAATLRWTHGLPADVKTPKDGRGDVHAGADGGRHGNVGRLRSRGCRPRPGAPIARCSRKASQASTAGCKNTARWSRSASAWRKPTGAWRSART